MMPKFILPPESFKVLLKELQSLGLDIKVLKDDMTEVEIAESVDYGETDFRRVIEEEDRRNDHSREELSRMGYQTQEFDSETGELVEADDDSYADEFAGDFDEEFAENPDEF